MKNKWLNALLLTTLSLSFSLVTFGQTTFPGTGTGAIPDPTTCNPSPAAPLVVSFNVTGISAAPTNVRVSMTFGTPAHTWMGDIIATLTAPNGTQHVVFGRTGATTATAVGDSSDLTGLYTFENVAVTNWWTTATATAATAAVPTGTYRTSATGNVGQTGAATDINAAFAAIPTSNGTWTLSFTDGCNGDVGSITAASLILTGAAAPLTANADYNGDGKTDWVVARGTNTPLAEGEAQSTIGGFDAAATEIKGFRRPLVESDSPQAPGIAWYVKTNGANATFGAQWGDAATDFIVSEDFDGDGKSDFTVWRPGAPNVAAFYILQSQTNTVKTSLFGQTGDDPAIVGDYDGDNKADVATYRCPALGAGDGQCFFYYRGSLNNPGNNITFVPWGFGENGDFFPNVGDYDGDGKNDFCIQRTNPAQAGQGQFVLKRSSDGATEFINWGNNSDLIIPGDYDGDGKSDFCVRRTVSGARQHWILTRTGNQSLVNWGITGDTSVPGDYDGDGKTDIGVWRAGAIGATGQFYILQSSNGASLNSPWGTTSDVAVAGWAVH